MSYTDTVYMQAVVPSSAGVYHRFMWCATDGKLGWVLNPVRENPEQDLERQLGGSVRPEVNLPPPQKKTKNINTHYSHAGS